MVHSPVKFNKEAVSQCGEDGSNNGVVDCWDQTVAAYTRSEPLDTGSVGYFLYGQNQAECLRFGTCEDNTNSNTNLAPVNQAVYDAFREGRQSLLSWDCAGASERVGEIRGLLTVLLAQGILQTVLYHVKEDNQVTRAQLSPLKKKNNDNKDVPLPSNSAIPQSRPGAPSPYLKYKGRDLRHLPGDASHHFLPQPGGL